MFVALAEIWEPAEARQVAGHCRLSVNTASAMLKKLVGRGAVAEAGKVGRKNLYQIVERLYNIYHLMRLSGVEADRVRALVRFMVPLYGKERVACALADEACRHEGEGRLSWIEGYRTILDEASHEEGGLDRLFKVMPAAFFKLPEASEAINRYRMTPAEVEMRDNEAKLWDSAKAAFEKGDFQQALGVLNSFLEIYGKSETDESKTRLGVARALNSKAWIAYEVGDSLKIDQAIAAIEKAISIMPQNMAFHHTRACLLGFASRWEEAFEHAKQFSDDQEMVEKCSQDILTFFVDAAAMGQAEQALRAIEKTKSEPAMEPLVVALKMSAGKPYRAPREVVEMANDIQRRILQRKEVLRSKMVK